LLGDLEPTFITEFVPYHPTSRDFVELIFHMFREFIFEEGGKMPHQEFNNDNSERLNDEFPCLSAHLSNFGFCFYGSNRRVILRYNELATLERFAADVLKFNIPAFLDFIDETGKGRGTADSHFFEKLDET
jgi:hypothetical protein